MTTKRQPISFEIWVLVASAFLIALGYGLVAPVLPQFAASFDVGVFASVVIVAAFSFVRLLFAPVGGSMINRFGERRIYLIGLAIVAISSALSGLAVDYWTLLVFRGLGGAGSVMFTVSSMGLLVRLSPPAQRGRTSSLYGGAFLLGNIAGPIIGSLLAGLGQRLPFFIYAATVLAALLVVWVSLRRRPEHTEQRQGKPLMTLTEALATPGYKALLVTAFALGWSTFGVRVALVPLMAEGTPSLGDASAGIAMTLFAAGNAAAQQLTGRWVDKLGRAPVLIFGLLFSGLVTLPFGWSGSLAVFLGLSVVGGVGAAFIAPATQAAMADIIGSERSGGQALSTYSMASDLRAISGTLLAGGIAQIIGFGWAFFATGVVLALAAIPWLLGHGTRQVKQ